MLEQVGSTDSTTARPGSRIPQAVVEFLGKVHLPDIWTPDSLKRSVLHLAASEGQADVVNALLGSSVFNDVDAPDIHGNTALHTAVDRGHFQIGLSILRSGRFSQASMQNRAGRTPLHLAASRALSESSGEGAPVLMQELLGSVVNQQDGKGRTALHLAAIRGHVPLVTAMVNSTVFTAVGTKDSRGMTALHCAVLKGHADVAQALMWRSSCCEGVGSGGWPGALLDIEAKDAQERTALDIALAKDRFDIAAMIQTCEAGFCASPSL